MKRALLGIGLMLMTAGCPVVPTLSDCHLSTLPADLWAYTGVALTGSATIQPEQFETQIVLEGRSYLDRIDVRDRCPVLVSSATGEFGGTRTVTVETTPSDHQCACPPAATFQGIGPPPTSGDGIFRISYPAPDGGPAVNPSPIISMRVAQLFTRGLTLLHPDQPMVAGQPVEFLLEADSHNIRQGEEYGERVRAFEEADADADDSENRAAESDREQCCERT